jgi:hypothetical protein
MGMSVRMIELHYGALLEGSAQAIRTRLDAVELAQANKVAETES